MIKELIKDIVNETIPLSQALNRAKVLAYKVKNEEFKIWINNELNGYKSNSDLPPYRIINCDVKGRVKDFLGREYTIQIDVTELDKELGGKFYKQFARQSIQTLETSVSNIKEGGSQFGWETFPPLMTQTISKYFNSQREGEVLTMAGKVIQVSEMEHILNITKQKLLDTLLELEDAFPNLEDQFSGSKENNDKVQHIITNNIYGNSNPLNIGIGEHFTQSNSVTSETINEIISELEKLAVDKEDLNTLKEIFNEKSDKNTVLQKAMKWIGDISSNAVKKGIELKLPNIIENVSKLIETIKDSPQ